MLYATTELEFDQRTELVGAIPLRHSTGTGGLASGHAALACPSTDPDSHPELGRDRSRLLPPRVGPRITGRFLRPNRASCKTAMKFLCFILMKRIPRGLAVDNQHPVYVRRRRDGTI